MNQLPQAWKDYVNVADKDKLISVTIQEFKKREKFPIVNLDPSVLEVIASEVISYLFVREFTYKELKKFQRLGKLSLRLGIPDVFFADLYENLKSQTGDENKELLDRLNKAFKALISPYVANYAPREERIDNISEVNLAMIKTLEKVKSYTCVM